MVKRAEKMSVHLRRNAASRGRDFATAVSSVGRGAVKTAATVGAAGAVLVPLLTRNGESMKLKDVTVAAPDGTAARRRGWNSSSSSFGGASVVSTWPSINVASYYAARSKPVQGWRANDSSSASFQEASNLPTSSSGSSTDFDARATVWRNNALKHCFQQAYSGDETRLVIPSSYLGAIFRAADLFEVSPADPFWQRLRGRDMVLTSVRRGLKKSPTESSSSAGLPFAPHEQPGFLINFKTDDMSPDDWADISLVIRALRRLSMVAGYTVWFIPDFRSSLAQTEITLRKIRNDAKDVFQSIKCRDPGFRGNRFLLTGHALEYAGTQLAVEALSGLVQKKEQSASEFHERYLKEFGSEDGQLKMLGVLSYATLASGENLSDAFDMDTIDYTVFPMAELAKYLWKLANADPSALIIFAHRHVAKIYGRYIQASWDRASRMKIDFEYIAETAPSTFFVSKRAGSYRTASAVLRLRDVEFDLNDRKKAAALCYEHKDAARFRANFVDEA